jgi:hypothetical protein
MVATIIHSIPGSNHTVYLQWPIEAYQFCDFDRENLHRLREISKQWVVAWHIVCEQHWAQCCCMWPSEISVLEIEHETEDILWVSYFNRETHCPTELATTYYHNYQTISNWGNT